MLGVAGAVRTASDGVAGVRVASGAHAVSAVNASRASTAQARVVWAAIDMYGQCSRARFG